MSVFQPKKRFSQNYLTDKNIAKKIVRLFMESESIDNKFAKSINLLEIGPGQGILTEYLLLEQNLNLKMVEIDEQMVAYLRVKYQHVAESILLNDVLKLDFPSLFKGDNDQADGRFSIIGNFPYGISSQILFKIIHEHYWIKNLVGMFQLEVAQRIVAKPSSKEYGILSVLVQTYFDAKILMNIGNQAFDPRPKVTSAVLGLSKIVEPKSLQNPELYIKIVKAAFSKRRKVLRNTLDDFKFDNNETTKELFVKRAEQLFPKDFILLANSVVS